MKGKTGGPVAASKKMKAMGRNLARASNQQSSAKVPMKYAAGGGVNLPKSADMGAMDSNRIDGTGFGSGKARGGKAQTKGRSFRGVV